MLNKNMWSIYRKWMIIVLLSGCVYVFGYSDRVTRTAAAPCIEECEDNISSCRDNCADSGICDENSTSAACTSCIVACQSDYNNCSLVAVTCNQSSSYSPVCQVQYGSHCPVIGGQPNCSHPDAFNAYFMVCDTYYGHCVYCPEAAYCAGSNGYPPCIPY